MRDNFSLPVFVFGIFLDERATQVLLLGPGEAGKSTVLKQLKCIYKGGIPLAEQRVMRYAHTEEARHNRQKIKDKLYVSYVHCTS